MGQILLFKNADFSQNAVDITEVFDFLKYTDEADSDTALSAQMWYNTIPASKKAIVQAIEFRTPKGQDAISALSLDKLSSITVAAVDGTDILRSVEFDTSDIVSGLINGTITPGTFIKRVLPEPLVVNIGEYFGASTYGGGLTTNRIIAICTTKSGNYGAVQRLGESRDRAENLGVTFYGYTED